MARKESEDRSRRVRRKHLELAESGRPAGQLGWGVRDDGERELVREAARRVLAGDGLMTITRDWNRRGVAGPSPVEWTAPILRRALLSSRVAGLREHGVDPSGRTLGHLRPAVWKEAIDRPTWDQVRAVLLNPERNTNAHRPTRYLLTGLIDCGVCGARLFSRPRDDHTKRYLCAGRRRGHQLSILAVPADELVAGLVLDLLTTASVREAMVARADASDGTSLAATLAALGAAQSRLQVLDDDYYVRGALTEGRYRSVRVKLEREIDRLHASADATTRRRTVLHPDPRALWAEADFAQRRQMLALVVERVVVAPGRPGMGRFDQSRVRVRLTRWARHGRALRGGAATSTRAVPSRSA